MSFSEAMASSVIILDIVSFLLCVFLEFLSSNGYHVRQKETKIPGTLQPDA